MTPDHFVLLAQPWWVNLFILVPFACFAMWRRDGLAIARRVLVYCAIFGMAFGFVEAAVVVYIRAAVGMLPGFNGTLADVVRESAPLYRQPIAVHQMPAALLSIETLRESATIVMLVTVALLAAAKRRERWAMFLWCFAWWDLAYYAGLWATVRWPQSMQSPDVLFLIPEPWLAQVWFPILVSGLTVLAVARASARQIDGLTFSATAVGVRNRMPAGAVPTRTN
jgi:hypothetical protein